MRSAGDSRILLHVGPHKTGTTYLQSLFARCRDHLHANGLSYPGDRINHNYIYLLFCDAPHEEHEMMRTGRYGEEAARFQVERGLSALHSELAAIDSEKILLSAEEFCRLSEAGIDRFLEFLDPFGPVHVMAFAREPNALILSDAQEGIKGGLTFADLDSDPPSPNYRQTLGNWLNAVGSTRMSVVAFPPPEPLDEAMARLLAIEPFPDADSNTRANTSLSLNAAKILSALNAQLPPFLGERVNPGRARIPLSWLSVLPGPQFRLSSELTERTSQLAEPEVRWLEDAFGIRFESKPRNPMPEPEEAVLEDNMAEAIALLLNKQARQMNRFVAERLVARSSRSKDREAETLLRRAITISPDYFAAYERLAALLNRELRGDEAHDLLKVAAAL